MVNRVKKSSLMILAVNGDPLIAAYSNLRVVPLSKFRNAEI